MSKIELDPSIRIVKYMNRITTAGKDLMFYLLNSKTNTPDVIYNKVDNKTPDTVLIIDYFTNDLISKFQNAKITIAFTEERVHSLEERTKESIKDRINSYYKNIANRQVDVIYLEGEGINKGMKFDLVIANPPYGKIGTDITYKIIQDIDFKEYVNLLPAGDYLKGGYGDIQNYISDIENLPHDAFKDASVTAAMAKISKTKVNTLATPDYLTVMSTPKSIMTKYYLKSIERFDKLKIKRDYINIWKSGEISKRVSLSDKLFMSEKRLPENGHFAYNKNKEYLFNRDLITLDDLNNCGGSIAYIFDTYSEKNNYRNFVYSETGFKFITLIFSNITCQMNIEKYFVIPNVDWAKPQTVQSILKAYDYTDEEITEVLNELKKSEYKYLDDISDQDALKAFYDKKNQKLNSKQNETNRSTEE